MNDAPSTPRALTDARRIRLGLGAAPRRRRAGDTPMMTRTVLTERGHCQPSTVPALPVAAGQPARQGDVVLRPVAPAPQVPADAAPVGADGAVLAEGRMSHILRGVAWIVRLGPDAAPAVARVWTGKDGATLAHERDGAPADHAYMSLAGGGCWEVLPQRVADPESLVERRARD